jgi:predicted enzyme related to lactoylglutathione lyase
MPADISLRLLVLKTSQVEKVRAFYQCLGVALSPERHGQGPAHYAGQVGPCVLEVYPLPDGGVADSTTRLGFAVADLGRVLESLRAAGTPVLSPPRDTAWGLRAVVEDPDGRAIELYQT